MVVDNLGNLYGDLVQLEEAERMYRSALTGREKILGPDNAATLSTAYHLGLLYHCQGKLEGAEQIYQRILMGREKALGLDHAQHLTRPTVSVHCTSLRGG
jgi:tetratricopeptide (TPR) repeat protein